MRKPELSWYPCITGSKAIKSIYVAVTRKGIIWLWEPGSLITFNMDWDSFKAVPREHANRAITSLEKAAWMWNKGKLAVQFKRVADNEPAVFQLTYYACCPDGSECLAESFFPGNHPSTQKLYVYGLSFEGTNYNHMENIFCHELGHILGIRHEFAQEDREEKKHLSVLIGKPNVLSVMNYFGDLSQLRIQETDYESVRKLYKSHNHEVCGYKIMYKSPKRFAPRNDPKAAGILRSLWGFLFPKNLD
ncbi:hypothetical protein F4805DRAFT_14348 [Annulohypoxylon moriforme]|nr:hypothetical protein F4805DRAFT_14348 [Annulohypoxylon moriforme]